MAKVAINGFGRIGRAFFKLALTKPELEIVAINDLGELSNIVALLQHDSVYGEYSSKVESQNSDGKNYLVVDGKPYLFLNEKDPEKLPWGELGIDIVVEATGVLESYTKASVHKKAGAKRVVITAPTEDGDSPDNRTVLMGINEDVLKTCTISSNGSCTTNSAASVMQILSDRLGIKKAFLNTTHAYTARQANAGSNIIPAETGAAMAIDRVITSLKGKFDGYGLRVPVEIGAISVITLVLEKTTTAEEVNEILKASALEPRWQGIFKTVVGPLVSSDIIGDPYPAIADLSLTRVVDGDLCMVYSWYDNEFGYTNSLLQHVLKINI